MTTSIGHSSAANGRARLLGALGPGVLGWGSESVTLSSDPDTTPTTARLHRRDTTYGSSPRHPGGPPGGGSNDIGGRSSKPRQELGELSRRRRDALKEQNEKPPILLSNFVSIEKYYHAADTVLEQFRQYSSQQDLDNAYIIGRRFALFSTESLPGHDYYNSPKPELIKLRQKNVRDLEWVTTGIERIVGVMDRQELERLRKQREEESLRKLEWEKSMRQRLKGTAKSSKKISLEEDETLDITSKLAKLNALFPQDDERGQDHISDQDHTSELPPLPPPIAPPEDQGTKNDALTNSVAAVHCLKSEGGTPLFAEPPSYSDLFLDTLRTSSTPSAPPEVTQADLDELQRLPSIPSVKTEPKVPIRALRREYIQQTESLIQSNQIELIRLGTFQGRLSSNPKFDSTNGCAVISPLVVATHIAPVQVQKRLQLKQTFNSSSSKYGISNSAINEIIDKRAPPVLQTVRHRLGLMRHALIIPSDVHDYLVDERILTQESFVGACGGNIMDPSHTQELVRMLVDSQQGSSKTSKTCSACKVGAALFFREHVVSIVKVPLANGHAYFDIIDSLPNPRTGGMASRTRCKDLSSFEAMLKCYAATRFSDAHFNFIDSNAWNDGMCDFDPRVFQAFVWSSS
ncbi:hypothetical protein THAOC_33350 [Thalassiosira oceanica]|uniref:Uncharacterized protein n=1 Tax=Thalassiosira oceanica TaxID=159749 RepID=K0RFZ4_THAOC|nr:hypothetical protein THAOC_33350 [Thalassiosira oceanica]|eukprot:EJK47896.1 hypothetical protein THAOC_33350 [Thalassiosira oceanica]